MKVIWTKGTVWRLPMFLLLLKNWKDDQVGSFDASFWSTWETCLGSLGFGVNKLTSRFLGLTLRCQPQSLTPETAGHRCICICTYIHMYLSVSRYLLVLQPSSAWLSSDLAQARGLSAQLGSAWMIFESACQLEYYNTSNFPSPTKLLNFFQLQP